jgi:hypothetical protein
MNKSICSLRLIAVGGAKALTNGLAEGIEEQDGSSGKFVP